MVTFLTSTWVIVAVLMLVLGCVLGVLLARTASFQQGQQRKSRMLEAKLQEAEKELARYQQEVTDHFAQTAALVNNLTQSYREVHEHLVTNALKLANVDISRQLLSDGTHGDDALLGDPDFHAVDVQPPRDWAPRMHGSEGVLSETFSVDDDEVYQKKR